MSLLVLQIKHWDQPKNVPTWVLSTYFLGVCSAPSHPYPPQHQLTPSFYYEYGTSSAYSELDTWNVVEEGDGYGEGMGLTDVRRSKRVGQGANCQSFVSIIIFLPMTWASLPSQEKGLAKPCLTTDLISRLEHEIVDSSYREYTIKCISGTVYAGMCIHRTLSLQWQLSANMCRFSLAGSDTVRFSDMSLRYPNLLLIFKRPSPQWIPSFSSCHFSQTFNYVHITISTELWARIVYLSFLTGNVYPTLLPS